MGLVRTNKRRNTAIAGRQSRQLAFTWFSLRIVGYLVGFQIVERQGRDLAGDEGRVQPVFTACIQHLKLR